jgi:hypothetical protein
VAVALLVARAFWAAPSMIVFTPYVLFWIWLIATSVSLIRRTGRERGKQSTPLQALQ